MNNSLYARDWYINRGYSPHLAAGVVGNFMQESGKDLNPAAYNKAEDAFGIGQWRGDRLSNLRKFAADTGRDVNDINTQLEFSVWEKEGPEAGNWSKIKDAPDAATAATLFDKHYERSAGLHTQQRVDYANQLMGISARDNPVSFSAQPALSQGDGALGTPMFPPSEPEPEEPRTWWDKVGNFSKNNSEELLAIGSGLLSGDDWASGISAAGQGLLSVKQNQREEELARQRLASDLMYRQGMLEKSNERSPSPYQQAGSIETPDGEIIGGVVFNPNDGQAYIPGPDGQLVRAPAGSIRLNNSDAAGSKGMPTFEQWNKSTAELKDRERGLRTLDKAINLVSDDSGLQRLYRDATTFMDTLIGKGLDPAEMDQAQLKSVMQELIGQNRLSIVGPGVMTEQDAMRVLLALGGDGSWRSNPEVLRARLTEMRDQSFAAYDFSYNQASEQSSRYGKRMPMQVPDRYDPSKNITQTTLPPTGGASSLPPDILKALEEDGF